MSGKAAGALVVESLNDEGAESGQIVLANSTVRSVLLLCMFLSGATALVYEVVCSRLLLRIFGATMQSSSTVLAVFMAGLALGALLAGKCCRGLDDKLKAYAVIEFGLGVCGLLLALVLGQSTANVVCPAIASVAGSSSIGMTALRLLFATAVLGLPTCLMGATLPVIAAFLSERMPNPGAEAALLYAANTSGAVAGAAAGGFLLLPSLGLSPTLVATALCNLLLGALVLSLSFVRRQPARSTMPAAADSDHAACAPRAPAMVAAPARLTVAVLMAILASGALSMILEVAWIRFFCLVFGSSTYAFSCVLAIFLFGLAGGCWLAVKFGRKQRLGLQSLVVAQVTAGLLIFLSLLFLAALPGLLIGLQNWATGFTGALNFQSVMVSRIVACTWAVLPSAVCLGAVFPIAAQLMLDESSQVASRLGRMYACSTVGAVVGSCLAGFVLLPLTGALSDSGIQMTIVLVASAEVVLAAILYLVWHFGQPLGIRQPKMPVLVALLSIVLIPVLFIQFRPRWDQALMSSGISFLTEEASRSFMSVDFRKMPSGAAAYNGTKSSDTESILSYREGENTTVSVGKVSAANVIYLKNDGKVEVSVPADPALPSPSCDLKTQVLLGQLPALVSRKPIESALLIGFGSGTTCGSMLASQDLHDLTVAELEPAVLEAERFFAGVNGAPLRGENFKSSRLSVVKADGRNLLASGARSYDAIVSQPAEPWVNGAGDLFTHEFWTLGKSRLKPGGLFCQWIQLYSITPEYLAVLCRTFAGVFPESVVFHPAGSGEIILIGWNGIASIDAGVLAKRFFQPAVRRDLLRVGIHQPDELVQMMVKGPGELRSFNNDLACRTENHRINTDDNLLLEFDLPKHLCAPGDFLASNLAELSAAAPNRALFVTNLAKAYAKKPGLTEAERLLAEGKVEDARNVLETLSDADPLDADSLWMLGYCQFRMNRMDAAEKSIRLSLGLDSNQFLPRLWLAKCLLRTGRLDEGLRQLRISSSLNPTSPEPPLFAAAFFARSQDWQLAADNLAAFERLSPNDSRADVLAAVIHPHLGWVAQAKHQSARIQQPTVVHRKSSTFELSASDLSREIGLSP